MDIMFLKTIIVLFCAVCVISLVNGCSCFCSQPACKCSKIVNENNGEKPIKLIKSQIVCIRLNENRTTGYSWQYSCSNDKICIIEKDIFIPPTAQGVVGAPGLREFIVKAKSTGTAKITLKYIRPWEKEPKPAKVLNYEVIVE